MRGGGAVALSVVGATAVCVGAASPMAASLRSSVPATTAAAAVVVVIVVVVVVVVGAESVGSSLAAIDASLAPAAPAAVVASVGAAMSIGAAFTAVAVAAAVVDAVGVDPWGGTVTVSTGVNALSTCAK